MTIDKKTAAAGGAFILGCALALPISVFSQNFSIHGRDGRVSVDLGGRRHRHHRPHGFPHPKVDAAISSLQAARDNLNHAAHDFAGHRVKALRAIDNALRECNAAVRYANTHDR
jgi:hypothetical protein